jgi:hypothetical protein
MGYFLTLFVLGFLSAGFADSVSLNPLSRDQTLHFGNIVKDAQGNTVYLNHKDAAQYCEQLAATLPSTRQWAQYAHDLGALGIQETAFMNTSVNSPEVKLETEQMAKNGYMALYRHNNSQEVVIDFYYSFKGYKRPANELGSNLFWTSNDIAFSQLRFYVFDGDSGGFGGRVNIAPIRCLSFQ